MIPLLVVHHQTTSFRQTTGKIKADRVDDQRIRIPMNQQ
ncbi:MAG: hypothetical protein BWY82_02493 [Verrucomicrobia bacterium ADurb.Bin474]|nr:MAG: hypothetical protein BWY82_02493 [Verrucomicrobia bacterium ADurb.Bin474]